VVLAATPVPCETLDELTAGADALVHTCHPQDLIETMPQQRIRGHLRHHSSVEEAAAPRRGRGSAR